MATLGIPQNTIAILQKYNFNFQKKFGQNFLIDTRVLERIIENAEITKEDCVLEIGPGIGTMTQYLAESAREVVAVEIDKNLIPILSSLRIIPPKNVRSIPWTIPKIPNIRCPSTCCLEALKSLRAGNVFTTTTNRLRKCKNVE